MISWRERYALMLALPLDGSAVEIHAVARKARMSVEAAQEALEELAADGNLALEDDGPERLWRRVPTT
jgi:hypothetical protein